MLLSVIIVSYNTQELTVQTIKSIAKSIEDSQLLHNQIEVIVVDNNSSDTTVLELKKLKQHIEIPLKLIQNTDNQGFGAANNQGLNQAKGEYILFLNSDTIVQKSALEVLVQRFQKQTQTTIDKLGILSPTLLNADLSYQPQGGTLPSLTSLFVHMCMLDDLPIIGTYLPSTQHTGKSTRFDLDFLSQVEKPIEVDWVAGTAMMIPRTALDEFGAFDQNIFMYGEDMELCMRARNHHYTVALDPKAQVIHLQNQSSSQKNALKGEFTGYVFIFSKHTSAIYAQLAKMLLELGALLRIFLFTFISKKPELVSIYREILVELRNT